MSLALDRFETPLKSHQTRFLRDYYKLVKPYLDDDFGDAISKAPSVEDLQVLAEEEFINYYGSFPTCAVFAPGSLTVAGKSPRLIESKSLSMAVQLVTLIVGKRSHGSKWCHVKILSEEIDGVKTTRFCLNEENLEVSMEEASWIRYLKATMQSFKAKRAFVPGFDIVIVSSVPVKRGLGSSSALVVALYTFLEAITGLYTGNLLMKTLACHMAEKLAAGVPELRLVDTLASVIGKEDTLIAFDARTLSVDQHDWDPVNIEMLLIECATGKIEKPEESPRDRTRCKKIMTLMNTASRWRTNPAGSSMIELLFPEQTISLAQNIVNEDRRISKMTSTIEEEQWTKLGKLLWENCRSARKCCNSLSDDFQRVMTVLESTEGVLGADIIQHGYAASIIALVRRPNLKMLLCLLNRMKITQQRYYVVKAFSGASVLFTYERLVPRMSSKNRYSTKLMTKYHLHDDDDLETDGRSHEDSTRALSITIPHATSFFH